MNAENLSKVGSRLVKRCGTRDPFSIARQLGIEVLFCENFGPLKGAWGSTVSHDSHNMTIVYKNVQDAFAVYSNLKEIGGGMSLAAEGKTVASLALNVGGLMSTKSNEELSAEVQNMKTALRAAGFDTANPLLRIVTLALPVAPTTKFTDIGLVDVLKQEFIPIFPEE